MKGNQFVTLANSDAFIYKQNKQNDSTGKLALYQTIEGSVAQYIEYFTIAEKHYLAVANHPDGRQYKVNSTIYQWNGQHFINMQSIPTFGASSFNFFKIIPKLFLTVTNFFNDTTYSINSVIYEWKNNQFEKFQEMETEGAWKSSAFVINNENFVVFANRINIHERFSVRFSVYKWSGNSFSKVQELPTNGAADVQSFDINGDKFLDAWREFLTSNHFFTTYIAFSVHPFVMCGETYLGVSNLFKNSEVYKFSGSYSLFIKYQEIFIRNVYSLTSFEHKGHTYLVFGKNSHSTLYKWI